MSEKPSRRDFLKTSAGALGGLSLAPKQASVLWAGDAAAGNPPRPNFIFVTTDGHRPHALSLNGNQIVHTPNFDRIGREGIQFRNSFVVNALCLPGRATQLTGLIPTTPDALITRGASFRRKFRFSPIICAKQVMKWRYSARHMSESSGNANGIIILDTRELRLIISGR